MVRRFRSAYRSRVAPSEPNKRGSFVGTRDIVSPKTREVLREYLVGHSLREIHDAFRAAGIECDAQYAPPVVGQRRRLVEQYYHAMDFAKPESRSRFLTLCESVLETMAENVSSPQYDAKTVQSWSDRLLRCLRKDGFHFEEGTLSAAPEV